MNEVVTIENPCSWEHVGGEHRPLMEKAVQIFQQVLGPTLVSVRLMGSIPRGETTTYSDADFLALTNCPLTPAQEAELARWEKELPRRCPVVPRVDLEAVEVDGLHPFRRFVLTTDSLRVAGMDPIREEPVTIDRQDLIQMITPDFYDLVEAYGRAVDGLGAGHEEELKLYSRVIGKDLLKCFRGEALAAGAQYERAICRIAGQLEETFPDQKPLWQELFSLYEEPSVDGERLRRVLSGAKMAQSALRA
jgi:hypothetical protein